jgi:hypothetical protein
MAIRRHFRYWFGIAVASLAAHFSVTETSLVVAQTSCRVALLILSEATADQYHFVPGA